MNAKKNKKKPTQENPKLAPSERQELDRQERIVEAGFESAFATGAALASISSRRLYRETHSKFADYCYERFNIKHSHAYRLIQAAAVRENISVLPDVPKPTNEAQVRPMVRLKGEDQRITWKQASARAVNGKITAELVDEVARELFPPKTKKTAAYTAKKQQEERARKLQKLINKPTELTGADSGFQLADGDNLDVAVWSQSSPYGSLLRAKLGEVRKEMQVATPLAKSRAAQKERLLLAFAAVLTVELSELPSGQAIRHAESVLSMLTEILQAAPAISPVGPRDVEANSTTDVSPEVAGATVAGKEAA